MFCKSLSLLGAVFFMSVLVGCASFDSSEGRYNSYITEKVPLLEEGPQQTVPATKNLTPGTRVRIVSVSGSFVYVSTISGDSGWVPYSVVKAHDPSAGDPLPREGAGGIAW